MSVSGVPAGNYKFGFYLESSGYAAIDQVRLLGQDGYFRSESPTFFQDFEAGEPGWTVDHGGGASGDWAATTDQPLIGTASARCFETPELGQPGQWAELRTPALFLNQANYVLEFARQIDLSQTSARFQVKLLDQNDNLVNVSADYPGPFWISWIVGGPVAYPANYANSIAVGASTDFDRRADYSDYGSSLFCVAPSNMGWNDVATTDTSGASGYDNQGNHFMGFGGTSAATPLTAGIAALVLSKNAI